MTDNDQNGRPASLEEQKAKVRTILERNVARLLDHRLHPAAIGDAHLAVGIVMALITVSRADVARSLRSIADELENESGPFAPKGGIN